MLGRTLCIVFLLRTIIAELNDGNNPGRESANGSNYKKPSDINGRVKCKNNTDVELYEGVFLALPVSRQSNDSMATVQLDVGRNLGEGRGKSKKLFQRLLPLFILPFLIQSAIIPFFMSALKFMLFKSLMVGKVAMALIAFNALRTSNAFKGRDDERIAAEHYGYRGAGMEEYGAYVN